MSDHSRILILGQASFGIAEFALKDTVYATLHIRKYRTGNLRKMNTE